MCLCMIPLSPNFSSSFAIITALTQSLVHSYFIIHHHRYLYRTPTQV